MKGIISIGSDAADIIAVGSGGTIVRYSGTGTTWSRMVTASNNTYNGIWGANNDTLGSKSNLWVVGKGGALLHWQGGTFFADAQSAVLTTRSLEAVWGSSDSDVWAVGEAGTILHYRVPPERD